MAVGTEERYHQAMRVPWLLVAGWCHAVLLAALAWIASWHPAWAPLVAACAIVLHLPVTRSRDAEPFASVVVVVSALVFIAFRAPWEVAIGWGLLGLVVAGVARTLPRHDGGRPDAADVLALGGWGAIFAVTPRVVAVGQGGWLAPALLLFGVLQLVRSWEPQRSAPGPAPPSRDMRGTLSLDGVVVAGAEGLPASVPIDLELRAGDSLAILCDSSAEAAGLADTFAGRRAPLSGEITIDGSPFEARERSVAVVAPGELFLPRSLQANLGALTLEAPNRGTLAAVHDACSLAEVAAALDERPLAADGAPLSSFHRLLVLAARVIPSTYRVVVVVDPMPWIDAEQQERWRRAIVRASVGRTAVWLTHDRELADRATHVLEYRHGALRSVS